VIVATVAGVMIGACGGDPPKLVHCDRDLECVKQAVISGLGYTRNCIGEAPSFIFGKEVKVCGDLKCDTTLLPNSCVAFGAGGHDLMFIGLQDVVWPSGSSSDVYGGSIAGFTMDQRRPASFRLKAADYPVPPTTHSDVEFYLNTSFGGGCSAAFTGAGPLFSACMQGIANGTTRQGIFHSAVRPGSFEFNRWCGLNQNGGGISC
jgi:hypothetical protein